ncbi:hypothetical protein CCACVL1_29774 [Corchorus capsularis]|uniref:Uncharacterized protein n=1 Tax=Corchorus capsularis TaxID=210143 RepID=A0A1R3G0B7_COCAP|nr:hypothetical protein CCACVL1_29774 [Corchorus capsularis]
MEWDEAGELTIKEEEEDEHVKGKGSPIVVTQAPFAF